jgi:outer membrane lipoprotein-sorting protein
MKGKLIVSILVLFILSLAFYGFAQVDKAVEYMKKVDEVKIPGKDTTGIAKMVLVSTDGKEETRKMKIYRKGDKKIYFFLYPPGVEGVAFLSLSDDQMYLYLPAFKKVRRIASSAKNENFMGTDMSYEDMAEGSFLEKYVPKIISEKESEVVIELNKKAEVDSSYSKIVLTVDKKTWVRTSAENYDKNGKLVKKMNCPDVKVIDGYPTMMLVEMTDVQSGHMTKMIMEEVKYDIGLDDDLFSQRRITRIK